MSNLCKCGCGERVSKVGNKYINGHWIRVNNPMDKPKSRLKVSEALKDRVFTKEWRRKISETLKGVLKGIPKSEDHKRKIGEAMKGKCGPENGNWKEDCNHSSAYHVKARKLFGKDCCEICGMVSEEHLKKYGCRFDMHYLLEPHDWTVMEQEAWQTLCKSCHVGLKNNKQEQVND